MKLSKVKSKNSNDKTEKSDLEVDILKKKAEALRFNAEALRFKAEARKLKADELKINIEATQVKNDIILERLKARRSIKAGKTEGTLFKMFFLSNIMTSVFTQDSNLGQNRLFTDDDLLEYKAKMSSLLKEL